MSKIKASIPVIWYKAASYKFLFEIDSETHARNKSYNILYSFDT